MFKLNSPCKTCPFRKGSSLIRTLRVKRVAEIHKNLESGGHFICHNTSSLPGKDQQHCAGAAIMLQREGKDNQAMQVFERLGHRDRDALKVNDESLFDSFDEMLETCREQQLK